MSDDVLITPGSRKQEFKDSSGNIDAKIELDSSGNLVITNPGGDISIGDTTADIFVGDGTNNIDIVFEQDGEIRGTSGVTVTLGASGSNVRMASDLNLNSNDITNVGDLTVTNLTVTGTTTTVNSTNTTISDSIIELNSGLTGANSKDIGFIFERGSTGNNAGFVWDESADRFTVFTTTDTASSDTVNTSSVANFQAGSFYGNGANLTSLNASNLSSGTIPSARFPDNIFDSYRRDTIDSSSEDFNTYLTTGTYAVNNWSESGDTVANGPTGSYPWGMLRVTNWQAASGSSSGTGTYVLQEYFPHNTDTCWTRIMWNGSFTSWRESWGSGSDGSGSGLDADLLDGVQGASYLRSDASDSYTGTLTLSGNTSIRLPDSSSYGIHSSTGHRVIDSSGSTLRIGDTGKHNIIRLHGQGSDDFRVYYGATDYQIFHQGNDGSGSGLDADTVDGIQGASLLRSDADDTASGNITITGSGNKALTVGNGSARREIKINSSQWPEVTFYNASTENVRIGSAQTSSTYNTTEGDFYVYAPSTNKMNLIVPEDGGSFTRYNGAYTVWDSGNDGAGSGLDADKLDGQQGSYYLDYNNFTNTPTAGDITGITTNASGGLSGGTTSGNATLSVVSLPAHDDRDMKPNTSGIHNIKAIRPFFSSYGGMTGSANTTYVDVIAIDTYSDSSGGGPSAITFKKGNSAGNPEMHIWKADWNGTSWSTGQRVFADNYHPNADAWTTSRTITLGGDLSGSVSINGSANVTLTATVSDDSHNHVISNVDGLQTALNGKAALSGATFTGAITGTTATFVGNAATPAGTNALNVLSAANGQGVAITFSDNGSPPVSNSGQRGTIQYFHGDGSSYGSGNSFILQGTESTLTVLADGKLMFKEGLYVKPGSGTGAGTQVINSSGNWVGGGNISEFTNDSGYITSSYTGFDSRYYTESEMQTYFRRGYIEAQTANALAVGWYTVATNTGDRAIGDFTLWDIDSGDHQGVSFKASHMFGTDNSNDITVLHYSRYSGTPIRYIRIKDGGTYDGAALQVYIDQTTNNVGIAITGGNPPISGWVLKDWIPDATDPGDLSSYGSFGERVRVDLDQVVNGGAITTGNLIVGNPSNVLTDTNIAVYNDHTSDAKHYQIYHGTTRVGEIGATDTTWLRINDDTNKNIYTPRYIRADGGFFVDGSSKGIDGNGNIVGNPTIAAGAITSSSAAQFGAVTCTTINTGQGATEVHLMNQNLRTSDSPTFAGALKVTETGTAQVIMIGNQDSGGVNKPAMIMGVNGYLRFGHGSSWSSEGGTFTELLTLAGGEANFTGTKLEGDGKEMLRYSDSWLRINPDNDFSAGIYAGTGIFRTDGQFQVGSSGSQFKIESNGNTTVAGNVTVTGGNTDGSGNAFVVNRGGGSQQQALRVENSGEVVVSNNYLYAAQTGTSFYSQGDVVVRGNLRNDSNSGADPLKVSDKLNVTGDIQSNGTVILTSSGRNLQNIGTATAANFVGTGSYHEFGNNTGAVSNDGSWNARLNLSGTSHARMDIFEDANDSKLTLFTHTGQNPHIGSLSAHDVEFIRQNSTIATLKSNGLLLNDENALYFDRASDGSDLSTKIYADDYPDGGYSSAGSKFWLALESKGGTHIILNSDGSTSAAENNFDHFTIFQDVATHAGRQFYVTNVGNVHAKGDITAFQSSNMSDIRLKKNIEPLVGSLEKVKQLQGVSFDWKDETKGSSIGFVAQDFEKVIPELIKETPDINNPEQINKSINYGNVVGLLVEAIKEQQEQIDELKKLLENK